jgi:hypothetical protein
VHDTPDERDVFLLHFAVAELAGELLMSVIVLGDHYQP